MSPETSKPLTYRYSEQEAETLLQAKETLAVITFDGHSRASGTARLVHTGLTQLSPEPRWVEVIETSGPIHDGIQGELSWSSSPDYLFCSISVPNPSDLQTETKRLYEILLRFIADKDYPHIHRIWNYFPDINQGHDDNERYKLFCTGRHDAFTAVSPSEPIAFPAACAIGNKQGNFCLYLISAKVAGTHFENPEQLSAYNYPRKYGPRSPSFARATLATLPPNDTGNVYISGTASIKGHETLHPFCTDKQIDITVDNIKGLLAHITKSTPSQNKLTLDMMKVYIRRASDLPILTSAISTHFPNSTILYVLGTICRLDLEVEIDATCAL